MLFKAPFAVRKIWLFCQKNLLSTGLKPFLTLISSANDLFHGYQFSQVSPNFRNAVEKVWRPTIFRQSTKSFVPWQLSLVGYIARTWPIKVPVFDDVFGYMKTFACVRCENRKIDIDYNIFIFANAKLYFLSFYEQRLSYRKRFPCLHSLI